MFKALTAMSLLLCSGLVSADMRFLVQDQHGQPLPDAVLEIISDPVKLGDNSDLAIVDQIDKTFVPELIIIQKGQRVDFPNSDNIRHHVYSFSPAKTFELKLYADRPEEPVVFDQHGVVVLGCNIHDSMVAYIYIAADQRVSKTDQHGKTSLSLTSASSQLSVWHANQSKGPENRDVYTVNALKQSADKQYYLVTLDITRRLPVIPLKTLSVRLFNNSINPPGGLFIAVFRSCFTARPINSTTRSGGSRTLLAGA